MMLMLLFLVRHELLLLVHFCVERGLLKFLDIGVVLIDEVRCT